MTEIGVATAAIQFFRSMGGSLAVAGLGALLTARLATGGIEPGTHAVFVAIVPLAALILVLACSCCRARSSGPSYHRGGMRRHRCLPGPRSRGAGSTTGARSAVGRAGGVDLERTSDAPGARQRPRRPAVFA